MSYNYDLSFNNPNNNSFYSGFGLNTSNNQQQQLNTLTNMFDKEDLFFSDDDENDPKPRLPLFGRCPLTNRAYLDTTPPARKNPQNFHLRSQENEMVHHRTKIMSDISNVTNRIPLLQISNQRCNVDMNSMNKPNSPKKISWSQIAKKPASETFPPPPVSRPLPTFEESKPLPVKKPLAASKPSLDEVKDDSLVAMTNKHGKGKYWFKSGCPTPDPRWCAKQQLMIGPIPGDVEYATLRSAFLSKGHTIHLFIQNNQAWLEKNQEKFGKKQVKFGYVVYTEPEVARRLLAAGHVLVGHARVAVKEMDGQPALFTN